MKSFLWLLFKVSSLRAHAMRVLIRDYYHELGITIPIGGGLKCPIVRQDCWGSFREVFIEHCYSDLLSHMEIPNCWLDIGCHVGYFTLWLASKHRSADFKGEWRAGLIDADSRSFEAVDILKKINRIEGNIVFLRRVIAGNSHQSIFFERNGMGSSILDIHEGGTTRKHQVQALSEDELISAVPPPYDLIKVDIEGAEIIFLERFQGVLGLATYLLLEWHSWCQSENVLETIVSLCAKQGFVQIAKIGEDRSVTVNSKPEICGVLLFRNDRRLRT